MPWIHSWVHASPELMMHSPDWRHVWHKELPPEATLSELGVACYETPSNFYSLLTIHWSLFLSCFLTYLVSHSAMYIWINHLVCLLILRRVGNNSSNSRQWQQRYRANSSLSMMIPLNNQANVKYLLPISTMAKSHIYRTLVEANTHTLRSWQSSLKSALGSIGMLTLQLNFTLIFFKLNKSPLRENLQKFLVGPLRSRIIIHKYIVM